MQEGAEMNICHLNYCYRFLVELKVKLSMKIESTAQKQTILRLNLRLPKTNGPLKSENFGLFWTK